jgi:serine phosphatase RsbU (regulator of sigma subunit)
MSGEALDEGRLVRQLHSLLEVSKALATVIDLDSLLAVIVDKATEVMEAERASIFIHEEATRTLVNRVSGQLEKGAVSVPVGVGLVGFVAETQTTLNIPDAYGDSRFNPAFDLKTGFRTRSILGAPLLSHDGRLMGVIQLLNKRTGGGFTDGDEALLKAFAAHAGVALERARLVETALEKERMEETLRLAHAIQMGMLPRRFPEGRRYEVFAALRPARSVGGDFYDFFEEHGRFWFSVGDVSGKGVGAALFMAVTKTLLRAGAGAGASPAEVLARVNRELSRDNEQMMFATVFVGSLDPSSGELLCANGGHNLPYALRLGGALEALGADLGPALGAFEEADYSTLRAQLAAGERLFLYTDGITEALDPEEREYTPTRLEARLRSAVPGPPRALVEHVLSDVDAFVNEAPQSDDLTVLAVAYRG